MKVFAIALISSAAFAGEATYLEAPELKNGDKSVMTAKAKTEYEVLGTGADQTLGMEVTMEIAMAGGDYINEDNKGIPYAWLCMGEKGTADDMECYESRWERETKEGITRSGVRVVRFEVPRAKYVIAATVPDKVSSPGDYLGASSVGKRTGEREASTKDDAKDMVERDGGDLSESLLATECKSTETVGKSVLNTIVAKTEAKVTPALAEMKKSKLVGTIGAWYKMRADGGDKAMMSQKELEF